MGFTIPSIKSSLQVITNTLQPFHIQQGHGAPAAYLPASLHATQQLQQNLSQSQLSRGSYCICLHQMADSAS
ncbi:hypothetical protein Nepgr_033078 [Nepenthes gracilis]|uniref:Uncharacterized protein n=1 Tax=Nepenthes gracilis TaxID=150966 RepID=A0AAD3TJW2_NEPGR|nr:hypothetical protein Nepgr_033078 [Nepenthes gracilis]